MRVQDIMSPASLCVDGYDSVENALWKSMNTRWFAVRNGSGGEFLGLIGTDELADRIRIAGLDPVITPVLLVLSERPVCCFADEDSSVAAILLQANAGWIAVIDRKRQIVGAVSQSELQAV